MKSKIRHDFTCSQIIISSINVSNDSFFQSLFCKYNFSSEISLQFLVSDFFYSRFSIFDFRIPCISSLVSEGFALLSKSFIILLLHVFTSSLYFNGWPPEIMSWCKLGLLGIVNRNSVSQSRKVPYNHLRPKYHCERYEFIISLPVMV